MDRRHFIKLGSALGVSTLLPSEVRSLCKQIEMFCPDFSQRKIILIQLAGGNDGLNAVIPIAQYDAYANFRPSIRIKDTGLNQFITLDSTLINENQVGLHPILTPFKNLYDKGYLKIIQGVGYPNCNKSHFKSTDLWLSGGDGMTENFLIESGWVGRFMEAYYEESQMATYPAALQVGSSSDSLLFHDSNKQNKGMCMGLMDADHYYSLINGFAGVSPTVVPSNEFGDKLNYVMSVDAKANTFKEPINKAFEKGTNNITYPDTDLGNQLKTVARLISGDLKTGIYLVRLNQFDTHVDQVEQGASHTGFHANLLRTLSEAVESFVLDLEKQALLEQTLTITFSEFGRKVKENADFGTDHGQVAPMFVFGKAIKPGVLGTNIDLSEATEANNYQIKTIQFDYRSVFNSIVQEWFGANDKIANHTFFDFHTQSDFILKQVPIVAERDKISKGCYKNDQNPNKPVWMLYPNPFVDILQLKSDTTVKQLFIYGVDGKLIYATDVNNKTMVFDFSNFIIGSYIVVATFENGEKQVIKVIKK